MTLSEWSRAVLADPAWPRLKQLVIERTGLGYYADKDEALADRISARLAQHKDLAPSAYLGLLLAENGQGPESEALVAEVVVGETSFFRYREQFDALATVVVPELVRANRMRRRITVWSAGCSNGAEVYSLMMLLRRVPQLAGWDLFVLGTDISARALAQARAGLYGDWTMRDMPPPLRDEYLERVGEHWRVKDFYRQGVVFRSHNLVTDPPPEAPQPGGRFDVVLCRNVLMYFDEAGRRRVLGTLAASLADCGWLLVGHAEAGVVERPFKAVPVSGAVLFRKQRPGAGAGVGTRRHRTPFQPLVVPAPAPELEPCEAAEIQSLLDGGRGAEAVRAAREWVARAPLDPSAHYHLGLALEPSGEVRAVEAFRRAVYLEPSLAMAHFHLMRLHRRLGHSSQAARHARTLSALLAGLPPGQALPHGGGATAGALAEATRLWLPRPPA
jgi:chemotaxis protein methyltransferase CheR